MKAAEPLFRYEYVRAPTRAFPCAHIQVHAHRDEFTYLLTASERGKPGKRARKDDIPRLSEFHFPLGGARYRPCLEDVLEALVHEFAIDTKEGWNAAIVEGREGWRRRQLRSAVRDARQEAAAELRDLNYEVREPDLAAAENLTRLREF